MYKQLEFPFLEEIEEINVNEVFEDLVDSTDEIIKKHLESSFIVIEQALNRSEDFREKAEGKLTKVKFKNLELDFKRLELHLKEIHFMKFVREGLLQGLRNLKND